MALVWKTGTFRKWVETLLEVGYIWCCRLSSSKKWDPKASFVRNQSVVPTGRLCWIFAYGLCKEQSILNCYDFFVSCMWWFIFWLSALNYWAVRLTKLQCVGRGREDSTGEMWWGCRYTQGHRLAGMAASYFPSLACNWEGATTGADLKTSFSAPFPVHTWLPECGCRVATQPTATMCFLPAAIFFLPGWTASFWTVSKNKPSPP